MQGTFTPCEFFYWRGPGSQVIPRFPIIEFKESIETQYVEFSTCRETVRSVKYL